MNPYKKLLKTYEKSMYGLFVEFYNGKYNEDNKYACISDGTKAISIHKDEYDKYVAGLSANYPPYTDKMSFHNGQPSTASFKDFFDRTCHEDCADTGVIVNINPWNGKPRSARILCCDNNYVAVNNEWYEAHVKHVSPIKMTCGGKSDPVFLVGDGLALLLPLRLDPQYEIYADAVWKAYFVFDDCFANERKSA